MSDGVRTILLIGIGLFVALMGKDLQDKKQEIQQLKHEVEQYRFTIQTQQQQCH